MYTDADLIKHIESLLKTDLAPQVKVLIMALAIADGQSLTADQLGAMVGMSSHQVHVWLRESVKSGDVRREQVPDSTRLRFVSSYSIIRPQLVTLPEAAYGETTIDDPTYQGPA